MPAKKKQQQTKEELEIIIFPFLIAKSSIRLHLTRQKLMLGLANFQGGAKPSKVHAEQWTAPGS